MRLFWRHRGTIRRILWRWQRKHYQKLLLLLACMQPLSNMGYAALTYLPPTPSRPWWAVSLFELVVDTMSTVILFAAMMHYARRAYAGVDYTFQATLFVIAASSMHLIGGWLTDAFGHRAVFKDGNAAIAGDNRIDLETIAAFWSLTTQTSSLRWSKSPLFGQRIRV